jgi:uncharacterized sulfatase
MNRRNFFRTAAAAAGLLHSSPPDRPNILFCIADDQSYPDAGAYGRGFPRTPAFDRVAREGVLFHNAFVSAPSCCPSRGSLLTGQAFYRLREASMNHTVWPGGFPLYPDLLGAAGYHTGCTGKGWGPGDWRASGRKHNPAGPEYNRHQLAPQARNISAVDYATNFETFLKERPAGSPFCFWAGFQEPHRAYEPGAGVRHGLRLEAIPVPGFLPDSPEVRSDLADYGFEIESCDRHLARMLAALETAGELENTLVVITADNGMPFPRAKATLYDSGTRVPLAVRWGARVKPGRVVEELISLTDFAPTFLEAAGLRPPPEMTGRSLMPLLESSRSGRVDRARDAVVFGIERHFPGGRANAAGYPARAIRTHDFLYIENLAPERNPMGDQPGLAPEGDPVGGFGDTDGGPAKTYLWENRERYPGLFRLAFGKRPPAELYAVREDPFNLKNLAGQSKYERVQRGLAERLRRTLRETEDPRILGRGDLLDAVMPRFPRSGAPAGQMKDQMKE